jgi:hypothetical protein
VNEFKPHDIVMFSGVYRAAHGSDNKPDDEVYILNEQMFPPCKTCGHEVRFSLERQVVWVGKHSNFA